MFDLIKEKIKSVVSPRASEVVVKCTSCGKETSEHELKKSFMICPICGKYLRIDARSRIEMVCDSRTFEEICTEHESIDFMRFPGYQEKLDKALRNTGEKEAVVCGFAEIGGQKCAIFVMDPRFIMASMGSVVGEKLTVTFEEAVKHKLPVVGFTASGGARMQEGIISLMQMAKVSGAVKKHSDEGNLYLTVVTDPTTGGVTASFAMQGDIIIAEPRALIGFAGRRVVEQTTKTKLPDNFQTSEFLLEHGFIDAIVERKELKNTIETILKMHKNNR